MFDLLHLSNQDPKIFNNYFCNYHKWHGNADAFISKI